MSHVTENIFIAYPIRWKTRQDEKEVDTRFKQRVGDIAFWKSELEGKLADLKREIEAVECKHIRLATGLGATSEPLSIAEKCLAHRGQRCGVDRVDDNVNKHLQVARNIIFVLRVLDFRCIARNIVI